MLFADLVGSTALADAEADPERTRVLLDRFYDAMAEEIEGSGGTVEKFVGDAVMAAFGAPAALEDHAERALHAALAMQRRLRELHGERLSLRIGVNTGDVVVGRPREGSSFVTGDAVNVAARLEQAAAPGEIVVGERTVAAASGAFEFDRPVELEAKGKPTGVTARRLVRALSLMRPRGVHGLQQAFVGREQELGQLRATFEQVVARGEPRLVALIGDAGVGKTRLVREFWRWLAEQEPQPLQRTGRCLSYGHGVGYWPLAEIMREHFALSEGDPPELILDRLGDRRGLALTLGLGIDGSGRDDLHPLVARERLQDAWIEFLEEEARERPAVVLVEDVHWADDELCDLLELMVARVDAPLLVLVTARPEFLGRRPTLCGARRNTASLSLETLPATETRELLERLLGGGAPPQVEELVVARAEGNPFFVEELVATFIDRGALEPSNGTWRWNELPGFRIPDTVQAVLAARIDLLPPPEKAALQAGAVIGRVFWTGPVYRLVGGSRPDFALLEERDFCRRRGGSTLPGEREYAIKHALTREVAYDSVPKARRAQLHASFAAWLEESVETADDHAAMLAHHFSEAVRPADLDLAWSGRNDEVERLRGKAAIWGRRAAAQAISRYEIEEAISLLRSALQVSDPSQQAEIWYELGRACALKYDGEGFTSAMEKAIELGGRSADVYAELGFQTVQRSGMWQRRPDPEIVDGWIGQALELSAPRSPQRAKAVVAHALRNPSPATAAAALAEAEALADPELQSHALLAAAYGALHDGEIDRACELVGRQRRILPQIGDPDHQANAQQAACEVMMAVGRFDELPPIVSALDEVTEGLTPHHRLHAAFTHVDVASFTGRWEEVRSLSPAVEHAVEENLSSPCPLNVMSLLLGAVGHEYLGDSTEALRLESSAEAIGMEGYGSIFDPGRLRLSLARRDTATAERLTASFDSDQFDRFGYAAYHAASTLLDALVFLDDRDRALVEPLRWLASGSVVEPFALRTLGWARDDAALLEEAADRFSRLGLDWHAGQTQRLLAGSD